MNKKLKIVVLAKQVPDTRNVGKDAMTPEGTVNRAALPAIFNPEDMNALEQALQVKDKYPQTEITLLTMGPFRAADIIRDALYRGADTLATSYALSQAIKKINPDIIFAGRQAIDGDTAQVGPQVAEKLNIPQVTYAEEVLEITEKSVVVKRRLERGVETVESTLPALVTVHATAAACRPRNAKFVMKYKYARTATENAQMQNCILSLDDHGYLKINEWTVADVGGQEENYGLSGSPTKVKKVENIVFQAKEAKVLSSSDEDINSLIQELIASHTIG